MSNFNHWHAMYLGAFVALCITNSDVAKDLADLTRSDEEAITAIRMLRDGREGDRVYPVLEWLRIQRDTMACTVRVRIASDGNPALSWRILVHSDTYTGARERARELVAEHKGPLAIFIGESFHAMVHP